MPVTFSCACGRSLRVKDELAGRKVKCPQCGGVLTGPEPGREEDIGLVPVEGIKEGPPPPSAPDPADDEVIGEVLPADEDDENDDGESMRERVRRKEERAEGREAERERERRRKR